jgi:hypothetical protein
MQNPISRPGKRFFGAVHESLQIKGQMKTEEGAK